jgi:hypothetical protein
MFTWEINDMQNLERYLFLCVMRIFGMARRDATYRKKFLNTIIGADSNRELIFLCKLAWSHNLQFKGQIQYI